MINAIDVRIRKFIAQNQTLTLATSQAEIPYCCSLFYAFEESEGLLFFMSSRESRHGKEMNLNSHISIAGNPIFRRSIFPSQGNGVQSTKDVPAKIPDCPFESF